MVQKTLVTQNTYDNYVLYCEDDKIGYLLSLLALQIDFARYNNYSQQFGTLKQNEKYNSTLMPKELKEKYNPTYIQKIIDMEK